MAVDTDKYRRATEPRVADPMKNEKKTTTKQNRAKRNASEKGNTHVLVLVVGYKFIDLILLSEWGPTIRALLYITIRSSCQSDS